MTDMLATGVAWLDGKRKSLMSRAVVYRRGTDDLAIQATIGKTDFESGDEQGIRVTAEMRDWIITGADLGSLGVPLPGDQIVDGALVYEVMNLGTAGNWRWDNFHVAMRIHTKEIGV